MSEERKRRPLWFHFLANVVWGLAVGTPMVLVGELRLSWWLLGAAVWGVVAIPITRRWERHDS